MFLFYSKTCSKTIMSGCNSNIGFSRSKNLIYTKIGNITIGVINITHAGTPPRTPVK